jgi:hypothetical protein
MRCDVINAQGVRTVGGIFSGRIERTGEEVGTVDGSGWEGNRVAWVSAIYFTYPPHPVSSLLPGCRCDKTVARGHGSSLVAHDECIFRFSRHEVWRD